MSLQTKRAEINRLRKEEKSAQELLDRSLARKSMAKFASYISPDEPPALHHRLLCSYLDKVVEGEIRRLMVFMPPGAAKSTYTSIDFPPYYLGKHPDRPIISGSHNEGLATMFGRKVRNIVTSKEYSNLFETRLSEDSRAKGEWETKMGGSYYACGVGSSVTGRRAMLGLIDDPIKGRKDADSELVRNDTWDWYISDFLTRLKPNAAQIIIQTRWFEDDLAGRILPDEWNGESGEFRGFDGQMWTVICIPAEARENDILGREVGEWLWPEYFTPEFWKETKAAQTAKDTRNWSSLYQQVPRPDEGTFFKKEWFKRYPLGEHPPLTLYGASDCAVLDEQDGAKDFTEHAIAGFDKNENLYFVDWWSGRVTMDKWIASELSMAKRYPIMAWVKEGGVIRRACEPFLKKEKRRKNIYFRSEWITSNANKAANCRGFQAMASMGQVYIPNCQWGDDFIDQLLRFIPNSNFIDDKVDVAGLFGRILDQTYGPSTIKPEQEEHKDEYGFDETIENGWKVA